MVPPQCTKFTLRAAGEVFLGYRVNFTIIHHYDSYISMGITVMGAREPHPCTVGLVWFYELQWIKQSNSKVNPVYRLGLAQPPLFVFICVRK